MPPAKMKSTGCCGHILLVDLHTVTKRAVRASVEQYSLKALEAFYGFRKKGSFGRCARCHAPGAARLELGETAQPGRDTAKHDCPVQRGRLQFNAGIARLA